MNKFLTLFKSSGMNKHQVKSLLGINSFVLRQYMNGEPVPADKLAKLERKAKELAEARDITRLTSENQLLRLALEKCVCAFSDIIEADTPRDSKEIAESVLLDIQNNGNQK